MELDIVRSEIVKTGTSQQTDSETLTKFEIMDGPAVKCKRKRVMVNDARGKEEGECERSSGE